MIKRIARLAFASGALWCAGCSQPTAPVDPTKPRIGVLPDAPPPVPVSFADVTKEAGITFRHHNGAFGGKMMPETMGSGVAFLDFDGDGDQDLYFVQSREWTPEESNAFKSRPWTKSQRALLHYKTPARGPHFGALYRNDGGRFTDITRAAGLQTEMYGMGATVGDFDNDNREDLYVTAWPRNYLFRNLGNAKFQDVAPKLKAQSAGWSSGAAWLDYDGDGWLDLFVGHYTEWTPKNDAFQTLDARDKVYSSPNYYKGGGGQLFHNERGRGFKDVSRQAGINGGAKGPKSLRGRNLGVALCDVNNDYKPDLLVTNDLMANNLFRNNGNGTFSDIAVKSGIAYSEMGRARAGMGVDAADIDHSDRESFVIGNFSGEMLGVYKNTGQGTFLDIAPNTSVGQSSLQALTFGAAFVDADNDGWPDMLIANGHVDDTVAKRDPQVAYAQRPLFYRNLGRGDFQEIGLQSGNGLQHAIVGRGLALADTDLDGDLDAVFTSNNAAPLLLRNDSPHTNNSIRLVLRGVKSNRDAIGATVKVRLGESGLRRMVRSGSSYLSQSELPLTLGLGALKAADEIGVRWPSGGKTALKNVAANQIVTVEEGRGIVSQRPFAR